MAWLHYQEKKRLRDLTRQQRDMQADESAESTLEDLRVSIEQSQDTLRCLEEELRVVRLENEAASARCKLLIDEARQRVKADAARAGEFTGGCEGSCSTSTVKDSGGEQSKSECMEAVVV